MTDSDPYQVGADAEATDPPAGLARQPALHDLLTLVRAHCCSVSERDGQLVASGVQGVYVGDRRVLSELIVQVDGERPIVLSHTRRGADTMDFVAAISQFDDPATGPTVLLRRTRRLASDGLVEAVEVESFAPHPVRFHLQVAIDADFAPITDVKAGRPTQAAPRRTEGAERVFTGPGGNTTCTLTGPTDVTADRRGFATEVTLAPGARATYTLTCAVDGEDTPFLPPTGAPPWRGLDVRPRSGDLARLVRQSQSDLDALRLSDPRNPADQFFAAGVPWYLTLFGRDSLWAARMSLALGTVVAAGTLRTLARRQGRREVSHTSEQPGKIIHEVRRRAVVHASHASHVSHATSATAQSAERELMLPAEYYGTVDATALWILLLHDAWRWGLDTSTVEELLPALERAVGWLTGHARDETGFLTYHDTSGHGLVNQGWKDSHDALQLSDGTIAQSPIAVAEAQGYAHQAAVAAADLLAAFDRRGGDRCLGLAAELNAAFRRRFWITDSHGPYPAVALDGRGRPVDMLTSNTGHLVGTGLLTAEEEATVAQRLLDPGLNSGFGLRTLSRDAPAYNPLSYHRGSVWVHDTAIAIAGLARSRANPSALASLVSGLLAAAPHFEDQMPELFGGQPRGEGSPVPYPASCRPQAWAAATGILLATVLAGAEPDVPAGQVIIDPPVLPAPLDSYGVNGLQVGGHTVDVAVTHRSVTASWRGPSDLRLQVVERAEPS